VTLVVWKGGGGREGKLTNLNNEVLLDTNLSIQRHVGIVDYVLGHTKVEDISSIDEHITRNYQVIGTSDEGGLNRCALRWQQGVCQCHVDSPSCIDQSIAILDKKDKVV